MELFRYPQKTNVKTSLDINEITPVYWNTLYPGDRIENLSYNNITRMITPIYPTLDAPKVELYAFAVPERLLNVVKTNLDNPDSIPNSLALTYDDGLNSFNGSINNFFKNVLNSYADKKAFDIGRLELSGDIQITDDTFINKTKLHEKFGMFVEDDYFDYLPKKVDSVENPIYSLNLSYFLAYKKIYFDFFRQKQLEQENYEDIFRNFFLELKDFNSKASHVMSNDFKQILSYLNTINISNTKNSILNSLNYNKIDNKLSGIDSWSAFKENIFSNYIKNEKILNNIDYGTQKDILLKVWNKDNGDRTSAKLIGYSDYIQGISQVVNTAQTNSNVLGEIGGLSVTHNKDIIISNYEAVEKTYIMILAIPRYKLNLVGYTEPDEWFIEDLKNYSDYNPNMELIQKDLYSLSFWLSTDGDSPRTILGYYKPFDYLRNKKDLVAGDIMTKWRNWTYAEPLDISSDIGLSMLKAQKGPFKSTLVSPNQDAFITEWEFSGEFKRSILPEFIVKEKLLEGN